MPDIKTAPTISVVVPFHNEEPNVIELYGRLQGVMEELGRSYQFVFVDDAVRRRRNFGQTAALAEFHPLHMNWVLVDGTKGNPDPKCDGAVDR